MESFDIDAFISQSFKKLEEKEKSKDKKNKKKKTEKTPKNLEQKEKEENIPKNDKMIIENIDKEKINIFNDNKIDMRIYNKINLEETKTEKNIQINNLIKPLFPNDEVFKKEFTPDKMYLLDKYINKIISVN